MKINLGSVTLNVSLEDNLPECGMPYHHKERDVNDPRDLINYVIPFSIEKGVVHYTKYYKDGSKNKSDRTTVRDFNKWFVKGA